VVLRGDAGHIPLADNSVDLICTSPPFYRLRSYQDGGDHYAGQFGSESDPREFIKRLLDFTHEWLRVLKPSGSLFVELGDTYAGAMNGLSKSISRTANVGRGFVSPDQPAGTARAGGGIPAGFRGKSRMQMPQRYAIGCTDFLGLILRQEIIWHHVNETPESVADRARTSHTTVYHFTKQPKYYSAIDMIRVPGVTGGQPTARSGTRRVHVPRMDVEEVRAVNFQLDNPHPLGRLPGSIWPIPSAPLVVPEWVGVDHYAAFPPELCRRVILGWSPPGICTACGKGRFPVVDKNLVELNRGRLSGAEGSKYEGHERIRAHGRAARGAQYTYGYTDAVIQGWACDCTPYTDHPERKQPTVTPDRMYMRGEETEQRREDAGVGGHRAWPQRQNVRDYHWEQWEPAETRPAVVLDPFGGTGTTALVASVHDRIGISVDMSADYCRLAAKWRTVDAGERARALGVPRPPPVPPDQMPLFEMY
jgi:DNA modification methylase